MSEIRNSLICADKKNTVGIVSELGGSVATFYPFDADGNTSEPVSVPIADLTQATLEQIPASRALPPEQAAELGYLASPRLPNTATAPARFTTLE